MSRGYFSNIWSVMGLHSIHNGMRNKSTAVTFIYEIMANTVLTIEAYMHAGTSELAVKHVTKYLF